MKKDNHTCEPFKRDLFFKPLATIFFIVASCQFGVAQCPDNEVISSDIANNTQLVKANIQITSDKKILGNSDVTFRAGNQISLLSGFEVVNGASFLATIAPCSGGLSLDNSINELIVTHEHTFVPRFGSTILNINQVTLTASNNNVIVNGLTIRGIKEGNVTLTFTYNGEQIQINVFVNAVEDIAVSSYLSTPMSNYSVLTPTIIINYFPTKDGVSINQDVTPFFTPEERARTIPIKDLMDATMAKANYLKFALEEGTKYKGYKNPNANPYRGIQVLRVINVYEEMPAGDIPHPHQGDQNRFEADLVGAFARLNLIDYINQHNVKDVWLHYAQHASPDYLSYDPVLDNSFTKKVAAFESRMSTNQPVEAHNSYHNIAPKANHTFLIHAGTWISPFGDFPHVRGHQIESMLAEINYQQDNNWDLFWGDFAGFGPDAFGNTLPNGNTNWNKGRCGNVHYLPNSNNDYDYWNSTPALSDIEDWRPNNTGQKTSMTANYVHGLTYNWPIGLIDLTNNVVVGGGYPHMYFVGEGNWYLYWMQNIPSLGNALQTRTGDNLTNWWDIILKWDEVIPQKIGLHAGSYANVQPTINKVERVIQPHYCTVHTHTRIPISELEKEEMPSFVMEPSSPKNILLGISESLHVFPNPFTDRTVVTYTLSKEEQVSLQVVDILGKPVATLMDSQVQTAGNYQLLFNRERLQEGTYFVILQKGSVYKSKKLLLLE